MLSMILKDLVFQKKNFVFSFLVQIILVVYTLINNNNDVLQLNGLFFVTPLIFIMMFVYIMCLEEEKQGVLNYLKTLPIKKSHIVLSKYIWCFICILLAFSIVFVCTLIVDSSLLSILIKQYIFIAFIMYLLWTSMFLAFYYRFGSTYSHYSLFIVPAIFIILKVIAKFTPYSDVFTNGELLARLFQGNLNLVCLVLLVIGIIASFVSYKLSVKSYIYRSY